MYVFQWPLKRKIANVYNALLALALICRTVKSCLRDAGIGKLQEACCIESLVQMPEFCLCTLLGKSRRL